MSNNHILVLGGNGFIGKNIISDISIDGTYFISMDISDSKEYSKDKEIFVHENVSKYDALYNIINAYRPSVIINSAAVVGVNNVLNNPMHCIDNNTKITKNLLKVLTNIRYKPLVIFFSTSEVYGDMSNGNYSYNIDVTSSRSSYALSKLVEENMYYQAYNENIIYKPIILRLFNIAGCMQSKEFVIPKMINSLIDKKVIYASKDTRKFTSVHFLTNALKSIIMDFYETNNDIEFPSPYNFCSFRNDNQILMENLAYKIINACKINGDVILIDNSERKDYISNRMPFNQYFESMNKYIDFSYDCSIDDIIDDTIKFYQN